MAEQKSGEESLSETSHTSNVSSFDLFQKHKHQLKAAGTGALSLLLNVSAFHSLIQGDSLISTLEVAGLGTAFGVWALKEDALAQGKEFRLDKNTIVTLAKNAAPLVLGTLGGLAEGLTFKLSTNLEGAYNLVTSTVPTLANSTLPHMGSSISSISSGPMSTLLSLGAIGLVAAGVIVNKRQVVSSYKDVFKSRGFDTEMKNLLPVVGAAFGAVHFMNHIYRIPAGWHSPETALLFLATAYYNKHQKKQNVGPVVENKEQENPKNPKEKKGFKARVKTALHL